MRRSWPLRAAAIALFAAIAARNFCNAATSEPEMKLPSAATTKVDWERDVEPLFRSRCYSCHGPEKQESGLRLDHPELALAGGDLGEAYVPGNSAESPLVHYVAGTDEYIMMPPEDSRLARFTPEEIGVIRAWIDQGAHRPKSDAPVIAEKKSAEDHWAFRRPILPKPPTVAAARWPRNPIDSFVLAKLEEASLAPAAEADRRTLIRRLSLDLTGLPPSLEDVEAFVNDSSPRAYERLVERLLESPHYGERWGLWWLDLARYADTNGYEIDRPRSIWLYRDWVVAAFNENMPFDQFAIEQLAGDMLPNATQSQRIATGFHRNTFINEEGGHNWEQFRWESIVDRVSTTSTVFLGLTMGCAQCHDHKYDPISQREYYEFFAFLNDDDEPLLEAPQPAITAERKRLLEEVAQLERKLVRRLDDDSADADELARARFERWRRQTANELPVWTLLEPEKWTSKNNATLVKLDDLSLLATGDNPEQDVYEVTCEAPAGRITGLRLEALPDASLPKHGPGRGYLKEDGTFLLSEISVTVHNAGDASEDAVGRKLDLTNPTASIHEEIAAEAIDGDKLTGWHIRKGAGRRHAIAFEFASPVVMPAGSKIAVKLVQNFAHQQTLGRFRIWVTSDDGPLPTSEMPLAVEKLLHKPAGEWSAAEADQVKAYYVSAAPEFQREYRRIDDLRKRLPAHPTTLVLEHRTNPRVTHHHIRGDFSRPGPEVTAGVPRFLPPLPPDAPRDRLTLARWLVSEKNPLAARVIMNQIWQCYFGRGLVNTPEDFGTQGAAPSHPELLDWLACRFMAEGWDLKRMHREIVTSRTYRQSSAADPTKLERDPENILLSRGPRFRLPAEFIRDIALTASGLMNPELGGPSIFTPQPAGALAGAFGDPKWPAASGADRYRRGLYTHRKRAAPFAAFGTFDAPPHSTCSMRRARSNTPLQALAQLNDENLIEAAQALAQRIVSEAPSDDAARLDYGFQVCLTRSPSDEERQLLLFYYRSQHRQFERDASAAATVAGLAAQEGKRQSGVADLAAWTLVSRVLLNLDETITKE